MLQIVASSAVALGAAFAAAFVAAVHEQSDVVRALHLQPCPSAAHTAGSYDDDARTVADRWPPAYSRQPPLRKPAAARLLCVPVGQVLPPLRLLLLQSKCLPLR